MPLKTLRVIINNYDYKKNSINNLYFNSLAKIFKFIIIIYFLILFIR